MLAAIRCPESRTTGSNQDIAVRAGPFIERAHPHRGDEHGTETATVALVHPGAPNAAAHRHGHDLGYTDPYGADDHLNPVAFLLLGHHRWTDAIVAAAAYTVRVHGC
ncbi:hypothetical protein [Streptomyces sp. NPDC056492]|uniref:hypothetical protein n=1 Tax=unclassified Streptomyces TaxID=2593676 RepID=UPI0036A73896